MKKFSFYLVVIVFVCLTNTSAQEYKYIPFPDSGVLWSEGYWPPITDFTKPQKVELERFYLNGEDTVINEITYKKLYLFFDSVFDPATAIAIGGIREDSLKRIYYRGDTVHEYKPSFFNLWRDVGGPEVYNKELLLYDFSLAIGDTFNTGNLSYPEDGLIVSGIDTVKLGSTLRRRFSFDFLFPISSGTKWIEGMGSERGLLFTSGAVTTDALGNDLVCFRVNDTVLYFNDYYPCCVPVLTNTDIHKTNDVIIVYPNPSSNGIVTFKQQEKLFTHLEIIDGTGVILDLIKVKGRVFISLDTEKYLPGIYFFVAKNSQNGFEHTGKFIIY